MDGGICTKEVQDLEDPVCFELGPAGGENVECAYFNESTETYELIEGDFSDPSKPALCCTTHFSTFSILIPN